MLLPPLHFGRCYAYYAAADYYAAALMPRLFFFSMFLSLMLRAFAADMPAMHSSDALVCLRAHRRRCLRHYFRVA